MKQIRNLLGVAVTWGCIGTLTLAPCQWQTAACAATSLAAEDDPDNSDGDDPEGGTVVDPVPQDDGTDGVDDGSGDDSSS